MNALWCSPRTPYSSSNNEEDLKSRLFDSWRHSDAPEVCQAVNELITEVMNDHPRNRVLRADDQDRLRATATALLLDLYALYSSFPQAYLALKMGNAAYSSSGRTRYINPQVSLRMMRRIISTLERLGWVEKKPGYYCRMTQRGQLTRIRARPPLVDHLRKHSVRLDHIIPHPEAEVIMLKGPKTRHKHKPRLEYEDTPTIVAMRENLRALNRFTRRHSVTLNLEPDCPPSGPMAQN